ncbi:hypothetical protein PR048_024240 [Dryococelus australis]|uniref:DDE Tnp4 domain-containing protein n=1 Tax=Dryococelus australis TaxID=614101 RepID=A0ABQ9GN20_9NEOP|nr:hypothetical protein PR048_024240 [Dryococelus australis]
MPLPTEETWKRISDRYLELWNMPNCIGFVDGKHIRIQCPSKRGSSFYNYKGCFSIILLPRYEYGLNCDDGVFQSSALGRKLNNDQLHILESTKLPDDEYGSAPFAYFFLLAMKPSLYRSI